MLTELRSRARIVPIDATGHGGRWPLPQRIDVVLADGHAELPVSAAPVVAQIHEAGWFEPGLRAVLNPDFLDAIERTTERSVRAATHVITPSESARRDVLALYGLDPGRVHAVAHGLDPAFTPEAGGGPALVARARARDAPPAPYVLYAAILHPRKNLATLREAMARLAEQGFPHLLVVAGRPAPDGSDVIALERAAVAELPHAPGRVVFMGQPSDVQLAALMAGADAYCLPSLYEGFGLTVLEAMACGTPVVVSDRGALPEVVGEAGVVVEPESCAVAAALAMLLPDPQRARRLGAAGAERAARFTWERTADGWLQVLLAAGETV